MASYSNSLLEALNQSRIACSILSPDGVLNCKPMPAPDCLDAPSILRVHQFGLSGHVSGWGSFSIKSTSTCLFLKSLACIGCRTHLVRLPNVSFFSISQVYVLCSGGGGRLVQQWDPPRSKDEVSWPLSRGLRRPAQDGCTWFLHRLRIC